MIATCGDDKQMTAINRVFAEFGYEEAIETVAEIGAIKVRFGDPSVRERLKFEARYTRYVSTRNEEERLF
ncbi:MAG: helicase DnaB, partial [Agrobacterium sp.]|nr:helicase DnaB [Agrobacterium sp.]